MSPELFYPEKFGLKDSRPTSASDCYALGMVVYEVLSRRAPFHRHGHYAVVLKVSEGERPERPQGAEGPWFADSIWNILQRCWKPNPDDRPRIRDVSRCLEEASSSWVPPQSMTGPLVEEQPTWGSGSIVEESTDEGDVFSSPEGNLGNMYIYSSAHRFSAPRQGYRAAVVLGWAFSCLTHICRTVILWIFTGYLECRGTLIPAHRNGAIRKFPVRGNLGLANETRHFRSFLPNPRGILQNPELIFNVRVCPNVRRTYLFFSFSRRLD